MTVVTENPLHSEFDLSQNPSSKNILIPWVWVLTLTAMLYLIYTTNNEFPFYSHPDTPGKVEQIRTGDFNFNHPLLLLGPVNIAAHLFRTTDDLQATAIIGRNISALFAAMAAALMSLLAWRLRGWLVGVLAGFFIGLQPSLFLAGHYLKEDTALLFGGALVLLALTKLGRDAKPSSVAFLGLACALASSGKYIGIGSLLFAIPAIWISSPKRQGSSKFDWLVFFVSFFLVFSAVNLPIILDLEFALSRVDHEIIKIIQGGNSKIIPDLPTPTYIGLYAHYIPVAAYGLIVITALTIVRKRNQDKLVEWSLLIFPIALLLVLSFLPKISSRYLTPGIMTMMLLAAMGIGDVFRYIRTQMTTYRLHMSAFITALLFVLVVTPQLLEIREIHTGFAGDTREQLRQWISKNIPGDAVIIEGRRIRLSIAKSIESNSVRPKLIRSSYLWKLGDFDDLVDTGATHVIIRNGEMEKAIKALEKDSSADNPWHVYATLQANSRLVWHVKQGKTKTMLGIEVYELNPR